MCIRDSLMGQGHEDTFLELLQKNSPRQISPSPPNYDDKVDQHMQASEMQHRFFLNEVRQHASLPSIRSYLKLYSTVELAKLAKYCGVDKEEFRTRLLALKHKSRMQCWKEGAAASGDEQQVGEVEFFIEKDVINVTEASSKSASHHADFFLHHIDRLHAITEDLGKQTAAAMAKGLGQ